MWNVADLPEELLKEAILDIKASADAESYGYGDTYYKLLDYYHRTYDASWMPQGYGCLSRDPSIPLRIDMSDKILLLEQNNSPLYKVMQGLGK